MPVNWVGLEGLNPYRVQTTRKGPLGATAAESAQKAAAIHAEKDAERQRRERMREAYRKVTDAPDDAHGKVVAARLMTAPVITVQVGERISVARSIVRRERYRHIPVVYEDRTLAGLLRDTDLIAWRPGKASKNSITQKIFRQNSLSFRTCIQVFPANPTHNHLANLCRIWATFLEFHTCSASNLPRLRPN